MDPEEYSLMFKVEETHWWYLGMEKITRAVLDKWYSLDSNSRILDAGCGTGAAIHTYLTNYGKVTGIDLSPIALKFCRERNLTPLALASVAETPFEGNSFNLVTSFDVLYEKAVVSDVKALQEFFRVLRPGGFILLRLPAYDWLRGRHDLTIHTARRYTAPQVAEFLKGGGFKLLKISYANTFLFPFALIKRLLERFDAHKKASSDLSMNVGVLNQFFKVILASEAFLLSYINLPYGLSVIAIGQKPNDS